MKKLNSFLLSIFLITVSILPFQNVFGQDVPLKKGDTGAGGIGTNSVVKSYSLKSLSTLPVTATLTDTGLELNFSNEVGIAQISILDGNGSIVYQQAISTSITPDFVISTDGLDSGSYTLKIAYETTNLIGEFMLY
jgi:hypothetical protein